MKTKFISLVVIIQLITFGCATATGPLFTEALLTEYKGKAIVYFYRNSRTGSASVFDLRINGKATLPLLNEGYYLLILEPGVYDFQVFFHSELEVENKFIFKGDKAYYIRYQVDTLSTRPGLYGSVIEKIGGLITSVPREEALEVLKECHLIEAPNKQ